MSDQDSKTAIATTTAPTLATRSASSTQATREMAMIHAKVTMALQRPRNPLDVRARMLESCRNPEFAEAAKYSVPKGGKSIEGLSIRFVEEIVRAMGNVEISDDIVHDDDDSTTVRATAIDYETMATWSTTFTVAKTMERKKADLAAVITTRKNSYGETVYVVRADEGSHRMNLNAEKSKAARTLGLRLVSGDLLNECKRQIDKTSHDAAERDMKDNPEATKRAIVDAFFERFKIMPSQLEVLIRKPMDQAQPDDIVLLRDVFAGLRSGDITWADAVSTVEPVPEDTEAAKRRGEAAEKIKAVRATRVKREAAKAKPEEAKPSEPKAATSNDEPPPEWEPGSNG